MSNKAKKLLLRAVFPTLVATLVVLPGALIVALLSSGYTMMSVAWGTPQLRSNWVGIFSSAIVMGLFFCFVMVQVMLVKRNPRRTTTKS